MRQGVERGGKKRNPLCKAANCMGRKSSRLVLMPLLCIQECLLFWERIWSLQQQQLCPVLHVLEHSRTTFEISFLRHRRTAFFPYPGCNARGWHGPAPPLPHKGSSWEVNKAIRQRAPAWCCAAWKGQSRTAVLTGSDIPIKFAPLHHSLFSMHPTKVPAKPLHNNVIPHKY